MQRDNLMLAAAVVGAVVFLALSLTFLYLLSPYADASNNLQLLSIGLNFVTSVLLIGIYGVLAIRQGSQNELQEGQQKLMEASHEPILQVLDVDSYDQFLWPKIRNIGNGPMKEMGVKLHFYVEDEGITVDSDGDPLTHSADSDAVDLPVGEAAEIGSLSPGQIGKLAAAVRTPRLGEEDEGRLGHLMNDFDERDIEEVVYQIEIYYDHLMRTKGTGRHFLKLRKVEVQRHLGVDPMIQHGEEYTQPELFDIAPNFREPRTYYDEV
ncbi:hypothetical protein [Haloferax sp. ATB1]|jgi:hypothetical protein|uniref:hypothetical protein n=1 Tax=Haloferax sp. ATB1 TaxID=1508454 RepID=UPI0005B2009C|nr:hypothetical protein [Haloferax sp. ATB1]